MSSDYSYLIPCIKQTFETSILPLISLNNSVYGEYANDIVYGSSEQACNTVRDILINNINEKIHDQNMATYYADCLAKMIVNELEKCINKDLTRFIDRKTASTVISMKEHVNEEMLVRIRDFETQLEYYNPKTLEELREFNHNMCKFLCQLERSVSKPSYKFRHNGKEYVFNSDQSSLVLNEIFSVNNMVLSRGKYVPRPNVDVTITHPSNPRIKLCTNKMKNLTIGELTQRIPWRWKNLFIDHVYMLEHDTAFIVEYDTTTRCCSDH